MSSQVSSGACLVDINNGTTTIGTTIIHKRIAHELCDMFLFKDRSS